MLRAVLLIFAVGCCATTAAAASAMAAALMPLGPAWAQSSVNTVVFRQDPITTFGQRQFAAYYDADGRIVIAERALDESNWKLTVTDLHGNTRDAHRDISLIADGEGYLHISWDHHGNALHYARSKNKVTEEPPEFTAPMPMTGKNESNATYPQFFRLADGNVLFLFRDGQSGRGNLVVNRYNAKAQTWTQLHADLISGEDRRNAYPQACVDARGSVHISWVWRESGDVATNHDLCYARSDDDGATWTHSDGTPYTIPITASSAELAAAIPQKSDLMNQTSMCADGEGHPIIATYFRPAGQSVVQYFVIHHDGKEWKTVQVSNRTTPFSLAGGGTKRTPLSRPQVLARSGPNGKTSLWVLFRDTERGDLVSMAACEDLAHPTWHLSDLTDFSARAWEPSYDHIRWQRDGVLDLFVEVTGQGDGETLEALEPQTADVLEWKPNP